MLRVKQDPDFRQSLIVEATNALLDGDFDTGNIKHKGYMRFIAGATDVRGIYGSPGA